MRLDVAGRSDAGLVRAVNEDRFAIHFNPRGDGILCVVADGMGGHASGELAASIAVQHVVDAAAAGEDLRSAIHAANEAVLARGSESAHQGMGTTIVCAAIRDRAVSYAHAGDSRLYLVRDGTAIQLTDDHSWVAEEVRAGRLTAEEARQSNARHLVTRALGTQEVVMADEGQRALNPGDALVLCSDGVHGMVQADELAAACQESAEEGTARLIQLANERGGGDNATAVIVRLLGDEEAGKRRVITRPVPALSAPDVAAPTVHARQTLCESRTSHLALYGAAIGVVIIVAVVVWVLLNAR